MNRIASHEDNIRAVFLRIVESVAPLVAVTEHRDPEYAAIAIAKAHDLSDKTLCCMDSLVPGDLVPSDVSREAMRFIRWEMVCPGATKPEWLEVEKE